MTSELLPCWTTIMGQQRRMERSHHSVPPLMQLPMVRRLDLVVILAPRPTTSSKKFHLGQRVHQLHPCQDGPKTLQITQPQRPSRACQASSRCATRLPSLLRTAGVSKSRALQRGAHGALNQAHQIPLAAATRPLLQIVRRTLQEAKNVGVQLTSNPSAPFDMRKGRTG
jgi:hypothetical protein